jgi:hypothetical protein
MTATVTPARIRWHRGMGCTLASLTTNPLGARLVMRPSKYGNPFRVLRRNGAWVVEGHGYGVGPLDTRVEAQAEAVRLFEERQLLFLVQNGWVAELAGVDLACSCEPGTPCHSDVLLAAAGPDLAVSR